MEGNMLGKASGSVTQFGHYSVNPKGPLCICGNHGCLEAMFSESQIKARLEESGKKAVFSDARPSHLRTWAKQRSTKTLLLSTHWRKWPGTWRWH
ncbi:MAG: ROK family protein [Blautia marasmi]